MKTDRTTTRLDTSVVVRYLTDDPPEMAARAAALIDGAADLALTTLVLVESAYVLTTIYQIDRRAVAKALSELLLRRNISCPDLSKVLAVRALELASQSGRISFADSMIWAEARAHNAPVATFDQRFPDEDLEIIHPR